MSEVSSSAHDYAAKLTPRLRTIALIVVSFGFIMDLLDSTIVNVAIPTIQHSLHASYSGIQWIIAGYSLTFALLLVTGGRMGDVFGYKKLFLTGIAGFTVASLLSGLAPNVTFLIIARLLQGSMAALMVPQVMSLMQIMYKPEERGAINGLFGGLGGVAASLGPVVSGLLIKANIFNLSWRPIFLINVPIGIVAIAAAIKYLPEGKSPHPLKLDLTGTFLVMTTLFLLAFPLIQGREYGWPAWSFIMFIASLPALFSFIYWQRKKEAKDGSPLILMSLFKNRSFGVGLTINLLYEAVMAGFFLTFALVLQIGLGYSPIHAALTGLPIAVGVALTMGLLGEKVIPRLGRKSLLFGSILMAIGLAITSYVFIHYSAGTTTWEIVPGPLFFGVGMGFVFGALFAAVLNGVDSTHAGSASGTLNAVQQVGGAIGVALIGVIFFGQLSHQATSSYTSVEPQLKSSLSALHLPNKDINYISNSVKTCFVDRSKEKDSSVVPQSCHNIQSSKASQEISAAINSSSAKANAVNFSKAFRWGVVFEILVLALAFTVNFLLPKKFRVSAGIQG
jgi:EmrB/QacA subfamily drug resistance transporter